MQALPKGDRGELAVEVLTEVGVARVVPWAASRSVAVWKGERAAKSLARWRSTAREAAKQARRSWHPEVDPLASTAEVVELLRRRRPRGRAARGRDRRRSPSLDVPAEGHVVVVVGPEGGIAPDELAAFVDAGARSVRLGAEVLRTSTAGVVACRRPARPHPALVLSSPRTRTCPRQGAAGPRAAWVAPAHGAWPVRHPSPRPGRSVSASTAVEEEKRRGAFSSRRVFILAAIGSAVGLGNIWRFPYVAYENGGGAFVIPYLVALLTAGIPFLLLDYGIGHKFRGSPPLSFARMRRGAEGLGWWQVGICAVIAIYYAAVLAWAVRYTFFSFNKAWGAEPGDFFIGEFLQISEPGVTATPVAGVMIPLVVMWALVIGLLALGVQKGIGATAMVFIPVLVLSFGALVVVSLFLPGAGRASTRSSAQLERAGRTERVGRGLRPDLLLAVDRLRHHDHLRVLRAPPHRHARLPAWSSASPTPASSCWPASASSPPSGSWPRTRARRSARSPRAASAWRSSPSRRSSTRRRRAP